MRAVHNVYFKLKDNSDVAVNHLIADCNKYLTAQAGIEFFAAGALARDLKREVNDRDWDVGLHLVFATQQHQAAYQDDATHHQFINENKANWEKVRVFDSLVD